MPTLWIIPHTHWDREWYHPAARFQLRLARLVDGVLAGLATGALPAFLLDGQGVVLDDYLAVRRAAAERLRQALRSGRLEAGPWYVLPDELLVSGEALVRNLLIGRATLRRHGAREMLVGYSPDAFGHSGALPGILASFGIGSAVVWRGFGGARGQEGDLFRWRGPDGAEVLLIHLPEPGYEYGANLPVTPRAAAARWRELRLLLEQRARSPHWLIMNGADHHAPQADLRAAVRALAAASRVPVKVATLGRYVRAVTSWAKGRAGDLPVVEGELREGRRHTWALQDTHGTRVYLKQMNAECQRLLERVAEPLAALASVRGADLRAELHEAWRTLLANHAHDSICGTSHDAVHREMVTRFARCRTMALETAAHALDVVTGRDADAVREARRAAWRPHLVVFNTVPRPGARLVEANVALFRRDVPVGPGSAKRPKARAVEPGALVLKDARGRVVPHQVLERAIGTDLVESPRHYPDCDEVEWRRVLFEADLPALGVAAFAVTEAPRTTHHAPRTPLRATATTLANEHLQVVVAADGTLTVVDLATREHYDGLGAIEDQSDDGDSYTAAPRGRPVTVPDRVAVRLVHGGPYRGQLEVVRRYDAIPLELTMQVVLECGSRAIGLWLEGVSLREDHRLRVAFPGRRRQPRVLADAHFGAVERPMPHVRRTTHAGGEIAAATAPMQRWVAAARAARGLCVISDGLPQYEVRPDGTVLVTVLRGVGQLSKGDLDERPGHAGWPTATPEGQCVGSFGARLAVMPAGEPLLATPDVFDAAADDFLVPPVAVMQRACVAAPREQSGPELEGEGLVFSAMKPAESGRGLVLRCFNARAERVVGAWAVPWEAGGARAARLDETTVSSLRTSRQAVPVAAPPRATSTILMRYAGGEVGHVHRDIRDHPGRHRRRRDHQDRQVPGQ